MTLDTYGHVFDELDRGERLSAEELIRAARQSQRSLDTNSRSLWALESVLGQEHG